MSEHCGTDVQLLPTGAPGIVTLHDAPLKPLLHTQDQFPAALYAR